MVVVPLLSLTFVALTLGLTFAHVLEIAGEDALGGLGLVDSAAAEPGRGIRADRRRCEILAIVFTWLAARQSPRASKEARYAAASRCPRTRTDGMR